MMKCLSCSQRKGKRDCPGLRRPICSVCCGEKRVVLIACPADCPFLISGNQYQGLRHYASRLQGEDAELFQEVLTEKQGLALHLQQVLVETRRGFRQFGDRQAQEAVRLARETCETEAKGVLVEYRSPDSAVESTLRNLLTRIAQLRQGNAGRGESPVPWPDLITCLKFLEKDLAGVIAKGGLPAAYLDFISRYFQDRQQGSPSGLIIP